MSTNYRAVCKIVPGYYQCCARGYESPVQHDADIKEFIGDKLSSREMIKKDTVLQHSLLYRNGLAKMFCTCHGKGSDGGGLP